MFGHLCNMATETAEKGVNDAGGVVSGNLNGCDWSVEKNVGVVSGNLNGCDWCIEKDVNAGGLTSSSAAGWTNWAMSGMTSLTSKIYKGNREAQLRPAKPAVSSRDVAREGLLTSEWIRDIADVLPCTFVL